MSLARYMVLVSCGAVLGHVSSGRALSNLDMALLAMALAAAVVFSFKPWE